jgi:CO/xanthine dehydrogenase FAD-binding subunit
MTALIEYLRPSTLDEAVELVGRPGAVVLAGGTVVNSTPRPEAALLVDLQALGLDGIEADEATVRMGAMVRLSAVAAHPAVPSWLRDIARAELPSSLRTVATIGGTVATADWESTLVAALLAADASVTLHRATGPTTASLSSLVADRAMLAGAVITAVSVDSRWNGVVHRTARTTADRPIVACVAATHPEHGTRTALTGVADTPVLVDDTDALTPPGDFRGSSTYRLHLARVLSRRAITELGA